MHTFTDWELRQLLEDTLAEAHGTYVALRACIDAPRGAQGRSQDWLIATQMAIQQAMDALWFESSRPTTTPTQEE